MTSRKSTQNDPANDSPESRRKNPPEPAARRAQKQTADRIASAFCSYAADLLKWALIAVVIGVLSGLIGALFYNGIAFVTDLRAAHPWLLFLLPVFGLIIVWFYRILRQEGNNTDTVIEAAREGKRLRIELLPAIFFGTFLTHLGGGSAGREGAALQIGGDIGNHIGALFRLKKEDLRIATMTGMAAFFSAVFGTPLTASVFVLLFINIGSYFTSAMLPLFLSSLTSYFVAVRLGMEPFRFELSAPALGIPMLGKVLVLALLAGLLSVAFVELLHKTGALYERLFKNPYLRVVIGGGLIIGLTYLVSPEGLYNGAGGGVIAAAILTGTVPPLAFLFKMIFTALTLEAGYKGGEIVPTFFIGAAFGCLVGPVLGIPAGFAAAVGLIACFAGATNTLLASVFLAIEAFGGSGVLYFALAAAASFAVSGYNGLYSSQKILYSKVSSERIERNTNAH